jgi:putative sugar O-methyltransferase
VSNSASVLDLARRHYSASVGLEYPEPLRPSVRWSHWSKLAANAISSFDDAREAICFAQRRMGFEHRFSAAESLGRWNAYERALLDDFPSQSDLLPLLGESYLSHPDTVTFFRGRPMSSIMFWQAHEFLAVFSRVPNPARVVEIGGGYGTLARLWTSNCPSLSSYWMMDFPESLFFAETYLRSQLPGIDVLYVTSGQTLQDIENSGARIVLCPVQLAETLRGGASDVIINCGSMQEMTDQAVVYWGDWIEASRTSYFYSLNYFLQPIQQLRGGSANWLCPRLGADWDCLVSRLDPPLVRLQSWRHFRELLYERVPQDARSVEQQQFLAAQILAASSGASAIAREPGVLELFEALRLSGSTAVILRLAEILGSLYDYRPKELVYVCRRGLESPDIGATERQQLQALLDELMLVAKEEHTTLIPSTPLF